MAKLPTNPFAILLLVTILTVSGCGVMPAGQVSTRSFNVTGFTLPIAMAYTNVAMVSSKAFGIAPSKEAAQAIVQRFVMQTVFDVVELQGRSALLPDFVISGILGQLHVTTSYEPILCLTVRNGPAEVVMQDDTKKENCIIVGNTVTGICAKMKVADMKCETTMRVPGTHLTVSGTLMTTNIIMANWSRQMWQNVVNRAIRMLALGPFRSHFFSAVATVQGN
ncbi:hypothetical protein KIN20_026676 [Parelaphostrongylus tenuis]|uniref:Uncharacterized protein n=1 Tax=Parelaphostrongylus tenuis TaxID=148309 RepID=A0AAD5QYB9_PARTN|nr:hypothetical protein KIN20_026676 [Parelaphostrongylus tenuis]